MKIRITTAEEEDGDGVRKESGKCFSPLDSVSLFLPGHKGAEGRRKREREEKDRG